MSIFCSMFILILSFFSSSHSIIEEVNNNNHEKKVFIVRMQNELKPNKYTNIEEWYKSILNSMNSKSSIDILHVYKNAIHGFSAQLTLVQANSLKNMPNVSDIFPDVIYNLQTTRSPHFLGLDSYYKPVGLLQESDLGSNVVIGVFDTGIWPQSPSFSDEELSPIPAHFKGKCDGGKDFPSSICNKKIVGVRYFSSGIMATQSGVGGEEFNSGLDDVGHGTHTASTAAGRSLIENASFYGYARGKATGIAPKSRLAIYKVCWEFGCSGADVLAAFDKAINDGVDIISLSLGGSSVRYSRDPLAIGAFAAMEKGIFVSASAGNSGPDLGLVSNNAPWMTTVGATTIDRTFPVDLILDNGEIFTGASLYTGEPLSKNKTYPLFHSQTWATSKCLPHSLDGQDVKGKIVVCLHGSTSEVNKGLVVKKAGGLGVVVTSGPITRNNTAIVSRPYLTPGLTISYEASKKLLSYISKKNISATMIFRGTKIGEKFAPIIAGFSSRGPNSQSFYVLKPDIVAPGVDILAVWPSNISPSRLSEDPRRSGFNILSGTSMSCPHISGVASLIKGSHPEWSPAMIRSALMTTAYKGYHEPLHMTNQDTSSEASLWEMGAGQVYPERANHPGLVYDITLDDYIVFLCSLNYSESEIKNIVKKEVRCNNTIVKEWDLNYPAIIFTSDHDYIVTKTLTNVESVASNYTLHVVHAKGANVVIEPTELSFKTKGDKQKFTVHVSPTTNKASSQNQNQDVGLITWSDGEHHVTIPLFVRMRKYP